MISFDDQKCGNCQFLMKERCHRFPPTAVHQGANPVVRWGIFPSMDEGSWCGEWAERTWKPKK